MNQRIWYFCVNDVMQMGRMLQIRRLCGIGSELMELRFMIHFGDVRECANINLYINMVLQVH